jgi:hypothetical protein
LNADVWAATPEYIDMRLASPYLPAQLSGFEHSSLSFEVPAPTPCLGSALNVPKISWDLTQLSTPFHADYHTVDEVLSFANQLATTFPHDIELVKLGQSFEDRDLLGIRIGKVSPIRKLM